MPRENPVVKAYNQGKRDATLEIRQKVLTYLEEEYMNPKVTRKTPLADGILEIASAVAAMMQV